MSSCSLAICLFSTAAAYTEKCNMTFFYRTKLLIEEEIVFKLWLCKRLNHCRFITGAVLKSLLLGGAVVCLSRSVPYCFYFIIYPIFSPMAESLYDLLFFRYYGVLYALAVSRLVRYKVSAF